MDRSPAPSAASGPADAVRAWWQAMQQQDLAALEALTAGDYVSSGGPQGRTTDRQGLIDQAQHFFGETTEITTWSIDNLVQRQLNDDVAVCAYDWYEEGRHSGESFAMSGVATDVLVRRGGTWLHQAHHVSMQMPPDTAR